MTTKATLDGDQLIASRYLDAEPRLVWETFTTDPSPRMKKSPVLIDRRSKQAGRKSGRLRCQA